MTIRLTRPTIVGSRESVRLAFVAALQHLSPRQRAVLVLRDVLQWKAAEVGDAIGASTAAVNSLLQRARAQLEAVGPSEDDELAEPDSPETKDLLDRYIAAFEAYDIDELVKLFTDDAIWEMPPFDGWYQGPEAIVTLTRVHCPAEGARRYALHPHDGQRTAGGRAVHAQSGDRQARGVPAACARHQGRRRCHMSWRSSTPHCSRSSACRPPSRRRVSGYATFSSPKRVVSRRSTVLKASSAHRA